MSFRIELPGAQVLFSTREGGVSEGPYESLNLGLLTGDDRGRVLANRRSLAEAAGVPPERVATGWQVHGNDVTEWTGPDPERAFLDPQGGHLKVDAVRYTGRGYSARAAAATASSCSRSSATGRRSSAG